MLARIKRTAARRRRVIAVAVVGLLLVAVPGVSMLDGGPADKGATAQREPEIRLNDLPPPKGRPRSEEARKRERAPLAIRARRPSDQGARADDAQPERIRKEDARLRAELAHLRALQAEQRRVARALEDLGGGVIAGTGELIWPLRGALSSPFGQRWGRLHAGVDIAAPGGTPIRAADSGRVALAGPQGGYGLYTCIQHGRTLSTCYAHQSELGTQRGAAVRRGQVIGLVGNTGFSFGDHLHFEVRVNGRPTDPMAYL